MKIKFIIIITALLSTLIAMQTIEESKITSKQSIQKGRVLSTIIPNLLDKKNSNTDVLNNKSLSTEKAISSEDIVEISSLDWVSSKTHNNAEIYNINKLDEFMKNVKNRKVDKVRIVKYAYEGERTWVNKLYDLEYNGKKIKYIIYDTYSNPNVFIPSEPSYYDKVIIRDYPNDLWYGICSVSNKGDDCATLISLNKDSIVK
ncbi:DUF4362 domain-containing protein [Clostridium gasigenes]|uniref:DUF4362 domain-containing protein n=1 Tax=Clostridium gasigenes TaxID=94869 RepID=UPI001C0C7BA5|nr:DUF4362 domain-containing protein [Clostridium gasigenes]MBU3102975.1 DUF4362 domain-containing protein [Clostridium gasigenes]